MLAKRIIPTMLVRGRTLVKGERFDSWRSIGHAAQAARIHAARGVDELMILDISATAEGRGPDLDLVRELSEGCFIPITVGGGVRSIDDVNALLRAGADKVCINTAAREDPKFIRRAAERFGSQAIVVCVEHDHHLAVLKGRRKHFIPHPAIFAREMSDAGAGEILLSSVVRDGTMEGYELDVIRSVSTNVPVPVIVSGGCRGYPDMLAAFKAGADACAAGAMFAFTDATPRGAAQFLKRNNIEVRV